MASVAACAVLAPLCAPAFVFLGAIQGAAEGPRYETIPYREQLASGAASDYLRELHWALGTAARDPAVRGALVDSLRAAQPGEATNGPGPAAPTLELEWTRVAFREVTFSEVSPDVTLEIELVATLRREGATPERRSVVVVGPGPLPRTFWLSDDRAPLRGAVRAQLARAARQLLESFGVAVPGHGGRGLPGGRGPWSRRAPLRLREEGVPEPLERVLSRAGMP